MPAWVTAAMLMQAAAVPYYVQGQLSGFRLVQSTPNTAVLAYHGKTHYSYKGQKAEAELNGATVYVKRKGEWAIAFHQDTPVPPPPPEQRKRRRR